jgi:hypothetical protein
MNIEEQEEFNFDNVLEILYQNINTDNKEEVEQAMYVLKDFSEKSSKKYKQNRLIKRALDMLESGEKITNGEREYVGYIKKEGKYYSFSSWDKTLIEVAYKDIERHITQDMLECDREFY